MQTAKRRQGLFQRSCLAALLLGWAGLASGQFDSGSDGSDGALAPVEDLVIDMADHPDGIYQYESVNVPEGVTVSFIPNEENTPVTWLIQTTCVIEGTVTVAGANNQTFIGGEGGPGGYKGGNGAPFNVDSDPGPGLGPGGAKVLPGEARNGGGGAYASMASFNSASYHPSGDIYGSIFLLPLIGGSGGGGGGRTNGLGGGGGGGAILIAANESITVNGTLTARGGNGGTGGFPMRGGGGSGGAIRLATPNIIGTGTVTAAGGSGGDSGNNGGNGRVRLEGRLTSFTGTTLGAATAAGGAGILMLPDNLEPDLAITSVAGIAAPSNPTGDLSNPDILIPITTENPMEVIVDCQDLLPGTDVTVTAQPEFGAVVSAVGDAEGSFESSTATISLEVPAGVGVITATAVNGVGAGEEMASRLSPGRTGLASNGEPFVRIETSAVYGGSSQTVLVTASGLRLPLPKG